MAFSSSLVFVLAIVFSSLSESTLSSNDSFSSESAYAALTQRLNTQQAQIDVLIRRSMQSPAACLGSVSASEFELYLSGIGIYKQVNTTHCSFREMPTYLTSLGGMNSIWYIHGATAIYNATRTGFRVYLSPGDNIKTSSELKDYAIKKGWTLNWVGLEASF